MDGNGTARQVMWQGTTAVDLGLDPACQVVDLNDSGHIVGNCGADVIIWVQGVIHAPAFEPTALATYASHTDQHCGVLVGGPQDMSDLTAVSINAQGAIAANWFGSWGGNFFASVVFDPVGGCP